MTLQQTPRLSGFAKAAMASQRMSTAFRARHAVRTCRRSSTFRSVSTDTLETAYKSRSYGTENYCPEGSSSMPQLRFSIRYDLRDAQNMVAATSDKRTYASVNGALGNDGEQPNCKATDADPDHGTSDYAESVAAMGKRSVDTMGWQSRSRFRSIRRN